MLKIKRKKNRNLNLAIAKSHQLAGQLVGMQLSIANVLALVVSAASVVAGATMLAVQQFPSGWPLWIAAAGIGIGLAVLIEGLTLSALIRIRVAGRTIREIEERLNHERDARLKGLAFPDPAHTDYLSHKKHYRDMRRMIERDYRRSRQQQTRQARQDRWNSFVQATGGCIASMCGGGLFYHAILGSLGQVASICLSIIFTLAVTGTFISSEVFKDLQEQAIREAFANGNLAEGAMRQETRMQSLWAVYEQMGQFLQSPDALRVIAEGGKLLVTSILEDLHQDLRRSLMPGQRDASSATQAISQEIQAQSVTEQAPEQIRVSQVTNQQAAQAAGYSPSLLPLSENDTPPNPQPEIAFQEPLQGIAEQATFSLSNGLENDMKGMPELDAIGRMMLSHFQQLDPAEKASLRNLAQSSTADVVQRLQKLYPGYAHFLTEKRIALLIQIIAHQSSKGAMGNEQTDSVVVRNQDADHNQESIVDLCQDTRENTFDDSEVKNTGRQERIAPFQSAMQATAEENPGEDQKNQHSHRRGRGHRERIKAVMRQAQQLPAFPSYRQIAHSAGVGYSTVKKYAREIRQEIQDEDP